MRWRFGLWWLLLVTGFMVAAAAQTGCRRPAPRAEPPPVKQAPLPVPVGDEEPVEEPVPELDAVSGATGPAIYECQTVCVPRYGRADVDLAGMERALDLAAGQL